MSSPTPTGRLFGDDLVLTRTFRAPMADVWASLTDPARTARWFGPWQGDAALGRTIQVQMVHEEGKPRMDMTIDACEPPRRLALSAVDEHGGWHLEMVLAESAGVTELRSTQHLTKRRTGSTTWTRWSPRATASRRRTSTTTTRR